VFFRYPDALGNIFFFATFFQKMRGQFIDRYPVTVIFIVQEKSGGASLPALVVGDSLQNKITVPICSENVFAEFLLPVGVNSGCPVFETA